MNISKTFTAEDLKAAARVIAKEFYMIPIKEKELTNDQNVEKYYQLKDLTDFMKTFSDANSQSQYQIFSNKVVLNKISKKSREGGQLPLEYSSDEDFVYHPEISQGYEDDNLF